MRRHPERCPMHGCNSFLVKKAGREVLVSLDQRPALRRLAYSGGTRGKNVERALRHRTRQPLRLVKHGHDEVTAQLKDLLSHSHEILWPIERFSCSPLGNGIR